MSKDFDDFKEIKKEKANLEKLIKNYQKRNEELNLRESFLLKKMQTVEPELINLEKFFEESENPDGYILVEPTLEILRAIEMPQKKLQSVTKLREEVLRRQYENLQLEKEVEARKEECRQFSEMLLRRKSSFSQLSKENYSNLDDTLQKRSDKEITSGQNTDGTEIQTGDEMQLWEDLYNKYNL